MHGPPATGLSEVITCMQHYVKVEYSQFGLAVLRERIRLQYAFNVAGTAGAAAACDPACCACAPPPRRVPGMRSRSPSARS